MTSQPKVPNTDSRFLLKNPPVEFLGEQFGRMIYMVYNETQTTH